MSEQTFYKLYGHLNILSRYLRLPTKIIRKVCKWDHGWTPLDKALVKEVSGNRKIVLVWNKRRKKVIEEQTSKKAFITGVPFIYNRKVKGLRKKKEAAGNVFFAAHRSALTDIQYDVELLHQVFETLPESYRPTTICLYWLDIEKFKNLYEQYGYNVVTAGDPYHQSFGDKLYELMSNYTYCSSNSFGTYALYALDLKIPFFLIGEKPELMNKGDLNASIERGKSVFELKQRIEMLFRYKGAEVRISEEQYQFFLQETGEKDRESTIKICFFILFYWIKSRYFSRFISKSNS